MATHEMQKPVAHARAEDAMAPTRPDANDPGIPSRSDSDGDIVQESRKLMDVGRDLASLWLERRRQRLADRLKDTSKGLRRFGDGLDEQPNMHAYLDAMADGLEEVSMQVQERAFQDFVQEARAHARRQPVLFFAGSLAVGLVASRILRAAADPDASR